MSATSSAIRFSAAFRTDFQHEFDAFASDVDFRLEEENPGGGSSDPDPDPGSGYGYGGDTSPPSPPSPPDEPYIETRTSIEAYSLEYFEAQGTRHGGNNGASTLSYYLHKIARGDQNAQYYKVFNGAIGRDIDRWYTYAFKINDIESMDFWGWVERDTSYSTDAAFAHHEEATRIYWEAYRKEWKIRFPQWDTREPIPPLIPPDGHNGGGDDGTLPSYLTRLRALLVAFASELANEPQAELLAQIDALMAAGAWVDAGENYPLMSTSSRIYAVANNIWFEQDLPEAVQILKQKLERSAGSLQAFFFPDKVLAALSMVSAIKELFQDNSHTYDVVRELVGLAETYAQLNPQDLAPQTPLQCWLYKFWQAQTEAEMREGLLALETWLQPVPMPMEILGFAHDLLRGIPEALGGDARLLKELVGLGKAYGVLDPLCAEDLSGGSFLDTLWSVAQMRRYRPDVALEASGRALGAQQLKESIAGRRAAPQMPQGSPVAVIRLTRRVLEALKRAALPLELQQSRRVLHDLVGLSWTYGALTPTRLTVTEHRREGFFLDTLWRATGEETIPQAAVQIVEFVAESTHPAQLFEFSRRVIKVAKYTPATRRKQKTASFLKAMVYLGREYGLLEPIAVENGEENSVDLFLHTVWTAQNQDNVKQGVRQFEELAGQVKDHTKLLKFERYLIRAAKDTNALEQEVHEVHFLKAYLDLGAAYGALASVIKTRQDSQSSFLSTLWNFSSNIPNVQRATEQLEIYVDEFIDPLPLINFVCGLLKAAQQTTPSLKKLYDTKLLSELINLGRVYTSLEPLSPSTTDADTIQFFLDTIWRAQDSTDITKGAAELESFLRESDNLDRLLEYESKLLDSLKHTKSVSKFTNDPKFVGGMSKVGNSYAKQRLSKNGWKGLAEPSYKFFARVWESSTGSSLKAPAEHLDVLLSKLASPSSKINNNDDTTDEFDTSVNILSSMESLQGELADQIKESFPPGDGTGVFWTLPDSISEEFTSLLIIASNPGSESPWTIEGTLADSRFSRLLPQFVVGQPLDFTLGKGTDGELSLPHVLLFRDNELFYISEGSTSILQAGDRILLPDPDKVERVPNETDLTEEEKQVIITLITTISDVAEDIGMFVAGAVFQWIYDTGEAPRWLLNLIPSLRGSFDADPNAVNPENMAFQVGRVFGDGIALVTGIIELIGGLKGIFDGLAACLLTGEVTLGLSCAPALAIASAGAVFAVSGAMTIEAARDGLLERSGTLLAKMQENGGELPEAEWKTEWPPQSPKGQKPDITEPGAAQWRYQRYRREQYTQGKPREKIASWRTWYDRYFKQVELGNRPGRKGSQAHIDDVEANNRPNDLRPDLVGRRVPDGVGRQDQTVTIRGREIVPENNGRVIVESDHTIRDGSIPDSAARAQVRDIRRGDPDATIVLTDTDNPNAAPLIYPPGTQPPPPGRLLQGQVTHVPYP